MDKTLLLKALADETRMKILTLLLGHSYYVRALAQSLKLSEATISQHLKVLREAGLLVGKRHGYFMHYDVKRSALRNLAQELESLAAIERSACTPEQGGCAPSERKKCHAGGAHSADTNAHCHGKEKRHRCHKAEANKWKRQACSPTSCSPS